VVRLPTVVAIAGVTLACVAGASFAARSNSSRTSDQLSRVALRPAQVGPGYRLQERPDSHCVQACVTLDLCVYTDLGPDGTAAAQVRAGLHGAEAAARNLRQFVK
jgi:hypothetical protein